MVFLSHLEASTEEREHPNFAHPKTASTNARNLLGMNCNQLGIMAYCDHKSQHTTLLLTQTTF